METVMGIASLVILAFLTIAVELEAFSGKGQLRWQGPREARRARDVQE